MLGLVLLLAFAFAQATPPPPAAPFESPVGFSGELARARASLDAGKLDEAREGFERALAVRPESSVCAHEIACLAARAGIAEAALAQLERAVDWGFDEPSLVVETARLGGFDSRARMRELIERVRHPRDDVQGRPFGAWVAEQDEPPSALLLKFGGVSPEPFEYGVRSSDISADGSSIWLGGSDGFVRRVELATGTTQAAAKISSHSISSISASNDGRVLVSCDGADQVDVLEPSTLKRLARLSVPTSSVPQLRTAIQLSPRGDLALTRGERILLWNVADDSAVADLGPDDFRAAWPRWSRDGTRFALADVRGRVRVFDAAAPGRPIREITNLAHVVTLEFADAADLLAIGTEQATFCVFDLRDGRKVIERQVDDFDLDFASVRCVRFSRDGRMLAATTGSFAFASVWSLADGSLRWKRDMEGGNPGAYITEFSGDGQRLFAAGMGSSFARVYDASSGRELAVPTELAVERFELSPTDDRAIGFGRHAFTVLDARTLESLYQRVDGRGGPAITIARTLHAQGDAAMWRRALVRVGSHLHPIDDYASLLDDRRRFRAACTEPNAAPARLPAPPNLYMKSPESSANERTGPTFDVELWASDARGLVAIEVEDVESGATATYRAPDDHPTSWHWRQSLPLPRDSRVVFRFRAIARSGIASDPVHLTVLRAAAAESQGK